MVANSRLGDCPDPQWAPLWMCPLGRPSRLKRAAILKVQQSLCWRTGALLQRKCLQSAGFTSSPLLLNTTCPTLEKMTHPALTGVGLGRDVGLLVPLVPRAKVWVEYNGKWPKYTEIVEKQPRTILRLHRF